MCDGTVLEDERFSAASNTVIRMFVAGDAVARNQNDDYLWRNLRLGTVTIDNHMRGTSLASLITVCGSVVVVVAIERRTRYRHVYTTGVWRFARRGFLTYQRGEAWSRETF